MNEFTLEEQFPGFRNIDIRTKSDDRHTIEASVPLISGKSPALDREIP